jgi:hypothetical protein
MTNFVSVSTNSARYQEISVNPLKLAGQCGKLKCCLNYELDTYLEALKDFPQIHEPLQTADGPMYLQKTDVLKAMMWFGPEPFTSIKMVAVPVDRVKEIIALNKRGETPELQIVSDDDNTRSEFRSAVGEDSLTRFDKISRNKKKENDQNNNDRKNNNNRKNGNQKNIAEKNDNTQPKDKQSRNVQQNNNRQQNVVQQNNRNNRRFTNRNNNRQGDNRRRQQTGSGRNNNSEKSQENNGND